MGIKVTMPMSLIHFSFVAIFLTFCSINIGHVLHFDNHNGHLKHKARVIANFAYCAIFLNKHVLCYICLVKGCFPKRCKKGTTSL